MKKLTIFLVLLLTAGDAFSQQQAGMNKQELLEYFDQTIANIQTEIEGLNAEQLKFSPGEGRWSVSQCLYHLVITEPQLLEFVRQAMDAPADPSLKDSVKITDRDIIMAVSDRSHKAKAENELTDAPVYSSPREALSALESSRKIIKDFIGKYTEEELRNKVIKWPVGYADAFQGLLFIAAHAARHTEQMKEVKSDPSFPKLP